MIDSKPIQSFVQRYNSISNRSAPDKFALFYALILSPITEDAGLQEDILAIIRVFVERIRILDKLIDRKRVPIRTAFSIIFPEFKTPDRFTRLIPEHGDSEYKNYAMISEQLMRDAFAVINRRYPSKKNEYTSLVKEGVNVIYRYAQQEIAAHKNGIYSEGELERLLLAYNCDFYLYNSLAFDLFLADLKLTMELPLRQALTHYFFIDGILDSFCDIFDDYAAGGFNFLTSWLMPVPEGNLRYDYWKSGTYDLFFQLAQKHYEAAKLNIGKLHNHKLAEVCSFLLEGEWQGLTIAREHLYFVDAPTNHVTEEEELVYKPHPWEIVDGNLVLRKLKQRESDIQTVIRSFKAGKHQVAIPTDRIVEKNQVESYYKKVRSEALNKDIIILRTRGCSRAMHQQSRCNHCGITKSYFTAASSQDEVWQSFMEGLSQLGKVSNRQIGIYCNGSFFDDEEVAQRTRQSIFEAVASHIPQAKLIFESHPQYITHQRIRHLRRYLPDQKIAVGVGFDSKNDFIRNTVLQKCISIEDIERAVSELKNMFIEAIGYVCLKPPFLTEAEGVCEAIRTGAYLRQIGVDVISIEPIAIQKGTLQDFLVQQGSYRVPWLWSCIEVARVLCATGRVVIGGFAFLPVPTDTARNCGRCTERIIRIICTFNEHQNIEMLLAENCRCKSNWEQEQANAKCQAIYAA